MPFDQMQLGNPNGCAVSARHAEVARERLEQLDLVG
jgi:hypothetical protein